jgi:iron complex outermembrane receptor protein
MRVSIIVFFLFCISHVTNAQQSCKVIDEETHESLPFASLKILNAATEKLLGVSGADGVFKDIPLLTLGDQYCISLLGYETFCTPNLPKEIYLRKQSIFLDESVVRATRMYKNPSNTTVTAKDLSSNNLGQDLPILLNNTPSIVTFSDAGNGFGYTGMRIRGVDASRINVTVNGIPINDAESQSVFWVNMPDFATSVGTIQIQRGIGGSGNGTAAFGSSINILSNSNSIKPYAEGTASGGIVFLDKQQNNIVAQRYSNKTNICFGTGKIGLWAMDARLSAIHSDGFVDNSTSQLKSYYIAATRFGKKSELKLVHFSGNEITGQAWNGIPESRLNNNVAQMIDYGINNRLNPSDIQHLIYSGSRTYNIFTYPNQTDNYKQDHYQLLYSIIKGKRLLVNAALHYTKGKGYFEEYKENTKVGNYQLNIDTALHISQTDLVRRRWLDNGFGGATASVIYKYRKIEWTSGGSFNIYNGKHLGEVIWARMAGTSMIGHPYYQGTSQKLDFNIYTKASNRISKRLMVYGDVQLRVIHYKTNGVDDNSGIMIPYLIDKDYIFFNPKVGAQWKLKQDHELNIYLGKSSREPIRSDIISALATQVPQPEVLYNSELGYSIKKSKYSFSSNIYLMYYKNQLVSDGSVNDVGAPNRINVPKSYRVGIELMGAVNIRKNIQWAGNITLSQNKIVDFNEYITFYTDTTEENKLYRTHHLKDLATSPNLIASSTFSFDLFKGFTAALVSKVVSKQYLDNTQDEARKISGFMTHNVRLAYELKKVKEFKYIRFSMLLNNILNASYQPTGYTYGWLYNNQRYDYNFFYPQAGFNVLAQITLGL